MRSFGPREPDWCRIARDNYWSRTIALLAVEEKLSNTEQGYAFVRRIKQAGASR